jgi:hypothetical protein
LIWSRSRSRATRRSSASRSSLKRLSRFCTLGTPPDAGLSSMGEWTVDRQS